MKLPRDELGFNFETLRMSTDTALPSMASQAHGPLCFFHRSFSLTLRSLNSILVCFVEMERLSILWTLWRTATSRFSAQTARSEVQNASSRLLALFNLDAAQDKKPRIRFVWLVEQRDSEGKQIAVWVSYPNSLYVKSHLCKTITTLLGRDPGNRFDLETLLGKTARILIRHNERNGRVFANIVETLKPRKSDHVLQLPPDFVRASSNGRSGQRHPTDASQRSDFKAITDEDMPDPDDNSE
jgi:hypothetical protein